MNDTDQEENADPCKDCICRWECLKVSIEEECFTTKHIDIILTSPTPWPIVSENEHRTFTVGVTHFVSASSSF